jgi:hypothetical protein
VQKPTHVFEYLVLLLLRVHMCPATSCTQQQLHPNDTQEFAVASAPSLTQNTSRI